MTSGSSDPAPSGAYAIRSVERVCDILDLLQSCPEGVSLQVVADSTGLPRSSAFRYLATLESRGYTSRGNKGGYLLGPVFRPLQERRIDELAAIARPLMQRLSEATGETINLGILRGTRVSYVELVESQRQVRLAAKVGDRDYVHCTALGKAIAADLSTGEVRRILDVEGLPRRTRATITDAGEFFDALKQVSYQGYAVDHGENEADGYCIAVSLPDLGFRGAVSYSAPANRHPEQQTAQVADKLRRLVSEIATTLESLPSWR